MRSFVVAYAITKFLVIGCVICAIGWAADVPKTSGPGTLLEAANVQVVDGDTIKCDVQLPWDVTLRGQTVRAANYDAWESQRVRRTDGQPPSEQEIVRGKKAAAEFQALVLAGRVFLKPGPRDGGFGRISAEIWVFTGDGKWVECGEFMTKRGHVRQ